MPFIEAVVDKLNRVDAWVGNKEIKTFVYAGSSDCGSSAHSGSTMIERHMQWKKIHQNNAF